MTEPMMNPERMRWSDTYDSWMRVPSRRSFANVTRNWTGDGKSTESISSEPKCQMTKNATIDIA